MIPKAIQTRYDGYYFRSRLEARWAVFFNLMGIKYQYECEGFELNFGDYYLPDFYLPNEGVWVEVKGGDGSLRESAATIWDAADYGTLPGLYECLGTSRGLLLLGDIPNPDNDVVYLHQMLQHHEGVYVHRALFTLPPESRGRIRVYDEFSFEDRTDELSLTPVEVRRDYFDSEVSSHYGMTREAYRGARYARFEHGETPKTP